MAQDPLRRLAPLAAVTVLGVGAEVAAGASFWWALLDLLVGVGATAGVLLFPVTTRSRALALVFAVLWFAGTLDGATSDVLGAIGSLCVLGYRAPLMQLLLETGKRRSDRAATVAVVAAWLTVFLPFGVASPLTAALAAVVAAMLFRRAPHASTGAREALLVAGSGTAALALVWGLAAAGVTNGPVLLVVGDAVVLGAVAIALAAAGGIWAREAERALVIELGPSRRPGLPLTARLARALADPELEVRYCVPDVGWLNEQGREVPAPVDARRTTRVTAPGGGEVALLHGRHAPEDARLARAAAAAAAISLEAARLDAEVRLHALHVRESRRRLLDAVDDERRSLEQRLSERVLARLRRVDRLLARRPFEAQRSELWAAQSELLALGRGLYPPAVARADLGAALRELAARFELPVRVEIDGDAERLPESDRAAVWFMCSESLTNVARHARATSVDIRLRVGGGRLELEIADDGRGGATLQRGLRGLADRIEALGGTFALSSPRGGPTVVRAVLVQ